MPTILADTFTSSLGKLSNAEQKQAKLSAFDLQADPSRPGLQMHRVDKSRDPNFWSLRVSRDLRIIVHRSGDSVLLAYVGHHDDAYDWAIRRRIEVHPTTGSLQIAEVREAVVELDRPRAAQQSGFDFDGGTDADVEGAGDATSGRGSEDDRRSAPKSAPRPIFVALDGEALSSVGVPQDWVDDIRQASEDRFLDLAEHLPPEAAEALLVYAATGQLPPAEPASAEAQADPFQHPDTRRRFRVLDGAEELAAALEWPFEKWAVFLHPSQRAVAERRFRGPARVAGSAGTGKTVVALHRVMAALRADPQARVLLTSFSDPLAAALKRKLKVLTAARPDMLERVLVAPFLQVAKQLHTLATGREPTLASNALVDSLLRRGAEDAGETASDNFLRSEWHHVVDAWQITDVETYGTIPRMGRKSRLSASRRASLWPIFERVRTELAQRAVMTEAALFSAVTDAWTNRGDSPFDHIVVDEAQDLGVAELRMLAAIAPEGDDALFFAGDLGQRIFQQPFSWRGLGVDVRGRSSTLRVNYRTSHQIRRAADRLLPQALRDTDGLEDDRRGVVSVFDGVEPQIVLAESEEDETTAVAAFLMAQVEAGTAPAEIGLFVRDNSQRPRALAAVAAAGLCGAETGEADRTGPIVDTMHLAKGLEFRSVVVLGCDEDALPSMERLSSVSDEFELDEVMATERQLLYVACTRARDYLLVTGVSPGSVFIEEMAAG
ncbi:3'-5' exonuclease [Lutibaculum baratangense]|uniref:DNA 3'-5' helicase n=1 Tax=Lutibaculum baratangense AMV1 TaxID=631454 RepID=V4TMU8_9HYPH|nr:3'-5' exonuclease [Lutibaculum baratangense]ESR27068.1 putative DNA helicase [Lutibaculum baratangense AMV1]